MLSIFSGSGGPDGPDLPSPFGRKFQLSIQTQSFEIVALSVKFMKSLHLAYGPITKTTRTVLGGKGGKDGKESTQSKQNQCTIKSYGEAMDLIEQLKLFWAEENLAFMEDVVEIEAKMTSVAVNSSSVQTKLESYFKH